MSGLNPTSSVLLFGSTLQGDHCGVDIATEAHTQMLQTHGLLGSEVQLAANSLGVWEAEVSRLGPLTIFFCISVEDTAAAKAYARAQRACAEKKLLGSPEKDRCGADGGKDIGAYLNSFCTIGAPIEKALGLGYNLFLQLSQLTGTMCGLHGAWVSMLIYRRPLMAIFSHALR